ncbi:hypothetical protein HBI25_008010 [Parastagonospora nodorum]|nr:hypothetical protein HBH51_037070 [Parastagonospora nodorum]KAH4060971.1 hypothetical protein HBH49_008960 [Parastagonospora nodorum]KAH4073619.1 hypothetical protein HBH50_056530 [Parastagonospora nodorum]KAH4099318.1 hypothetical protein HBH48_005590 [Parastagonospora nodorum]KAH4110901.1 hypothetical protein HBH46_005120 [Parastagonospora nodorum]
MNRGVLPRSSLVSVLTARNPAMLTTTTQPRAHRLFASVPYLLSSLVSHRHLLRNPLSCNILSCDLFLSTAMVPRQPRRQPPCTTRTVTGDPKSSPLSTIPSDSPSLGVANVTGSRVASVSRLSTIGSGLIVPCIRSSHPASRL